MMHWLFWVGMVMGADLNPKLQTMQDGTPVVWVQRPDSQRTTMVWSLARGSANIEYVEWLSLWADVLPLGSMVHRGEGWAWTLAEIGAEIRVGVSPSRVWFWMDAPIGMEGQAVGALVTLLDGWRPPVVHARQLVRLKRREGAYRGLGDVGERLKQRWLGVEGCPVEPEVRWEEVPLIGLRKNLLDVHREMLNYGQPSLTVRGPHGVGHLKEELEPLLWRGGDAVRLECSAGAEEDQFKGQVIVVDYPSSSVHIRAIQPLSSAVNVRHAEAVWKSLNTYSGDLAHSLRGESGLSYGHHHQLSHQPGLDFVELSLQVDGENVVSVIQRVEAEMAHRRRSGIEQFEWKVGQLQVHRESMVRMFHASEDTSWWSWHLHLGFFTDADVVSVDSLAWDAEQVEYALQDMTSIERRTWLLVGDYSMIGPSLQAAGIEVDAVWDPESL